MIKENDIYLSKNPRLRVLLVGFGQLRLGGLAALLAVVEKQHAQQGQDDGGNRTSQQVENLAQLFHISFYLLQNYHRSPDRERTPPGIR